MILALCAVLCLATGFAVVCLGWSRTTPGAADLLLKASLSVGYGLGVFSVVFVLCRVLAISNLVVADLGVLGLLLASYFFFRARVPVADTAVSTERRAESGWFQLALTAAFAVALGAAVYSAVMWMLARPNGQGWDAFSIWNLHARFLFRGGAAHWRDGFSPLIPFSHPDYPLLVPAAVAHFWTCLGFEASLVPALIGAVFTFGTVGLLFSVLWVLRGRTAALLGGITLLSTPSFIDLGTWQYSDVPLSYFFLATVCLLCLDDDDDAGEDLQRRGGRRLVLAGLAAGFGAWTKNEGVLFLCAIIVARSLIALRSRSRGEVQAAGQSRLAPLLAAAAPIFVLIVCFKHLVQPPGDLFSGPATMLPRLLRPDRYWSIFQSFVRQFFRCGHWLLIPVTVAMAGYYFAVGKDDRHSRQFGVRSGVLAVALTLAGYFAVYVITPYDIFWHLRFSLDRLFLHLWPSAVFLFFLAVRDEPQTDGLGASAGRAV